MIILASKKITKTLSNIFTSKNFNKSNFIKCKKRLFVNQFMVRKNITYLDKYKKFKYKNIL